MVKHIKRSIFIFTIILLLLNSCSEKQRVRQEQDKLDSTNSEFSVNDSAQYDFKKFTLKDFYSNNESLNVKVERVFSSLSYEERVAQMIIASAGELGKTSEYIDKLINEKKIGGVVFLRGTADSFSFLIMHFSQINRETKMPPLLFSCDAEPSLVNSRIQKSPKVLATNEIHSTKECITTALSISSLLRTLGIHQNYAPVCDFDLNKEIIGNRSFGRDSKTVTTLCNVFIKTTQDSNVVATAKHFPGHGTVKGDSHKSIVYIDGKLPELEVFREVIKAGVISMMVGHIAIKNNAEYNTNGLPSSLSRGIVTGLLKEKLGFRGVVVTDAMNMGAVTGFQNCSLEAVKAGCDLILMPTDESKLHSSIVSEMKMNKQFEEQVKISVKKIIKLKICLGLL